jgi:hypothetical protein
MQSICFAVSYLDVNTIMEPLSQVSSEGVCDLSSVEFADLKTIRLDLTT